MSSNLEIFFSYAWGDEHKPGESRERIVNELYDSLVKDNYRVVRDKYNLEYKGFISAFMTRIGKGKCIIVAISQKYVKSPYCMFELYEIARNSNFDKEQFREKVLPVMVEFIDFTDPAVIEDHFSYWGNEYKEWDDLVRKHAGQLSVEQMQRYDKIKMIYQNFGRLSEWIIDMNSLNPRLLSAGNFAEIKKAILNKGTEVLSEETVPANKVIEGSHGFGWRLKKMPVFWITTVLASVIAILIIPSLLETKNKDIGRVVRPSHSSFVTVGNAGGHLLIVQDVNTKKFGYALAKDTILFISCKYDEANPFIEGMARVKNSGKYHWIKPDSTDAFKGEFVHAEDFQEGKAKVADEGDTFYINKKGVRQPNGSGILPPPPPPPMCKGICITNDIAGVEVSFTDHRSNKKYIQVSGGGNDLVFDIPCYLLEGSHNVRFRDNTDSETHNVALKKFEIPGSFKRCKGICNTKNITGVEVSFRDPKNGKKYSQESRGNELEFDIPCYLLDKSVSVTFIKNDQSETRNVRLRAFEIPELFRSN